MNNPYFPNRKIQHAEILTKAGFTINQWWYRDKDKPQKLCDVTKLIYWKSKDFPDIGLIFFDHQKNFSKEIDQTF